METVPLVSICCLTYNHERFIAECLDGFLKQETTFPVEVLIHDDASVDGTAEIIRIYAARHPQIVYPILQMENQYSKKKYPMSIFLYPRVKGEYIALCEGDDYWIDSSKLEKQVSALQLCPKYSSSFHETEVIFNGEFTGRKYGVTIKSELKAEDTIAAYAPFHTSSFIFRSKISPRLMTMPRVTSGDMYHFSVASAHGPIVKVAGVMSVYRKHDGGITSSRLVIDRFHQDRIKLIHLLDEMHEFKYEAKAAEVIAFHNRKISIANGLKKR
ncbi:Putative glycosyltransferase EpsE [Thiorhodovibrio litoralis]|nr:Putative glycosyltransferase EpsE [Thiorhodovibrio litoralis]